MTGPAYPHDSEVDPVRHGTWRNGRPRHQCGGAGLIHSHNLGMKLAGGAPNVITLADFAGSREHGVRFSNGYVDGPAFHALTGIGELIEAGRFWLPVDKPFPLADIAEAHRVIENGHVRGRLVLVTG